MQPIEFAGLARLLGVQLIEQAEGEEKPKVRDFTEIFGDVMEKYDKLNRQRKREILKLVKKSNGARGVVNASNTEDT